MYKGWMVRAGRGGRFFDNFEQGGYAAIGWNKLGDLSQYDDKDSIRKAYLTYYGNEKPSKTANAIAILYKFKFGIKQGDYVITYSPKVREYRIGLDRGKYIFNAKISDEYAQTRKIQWLGRIKRDQLSQKSRSSLSSVLTLFALNEEVMGEIIAILKERETQSA